MSCPSLSTPATVYQPSFEALERIAAGGAKSIHAWMDDIQRCGVRRLLVQYVSQLSMVSSGPGDQAVPTTPTKAPHYRILVDPAPDKHPWAGSWVAKEILRAAHRKGIQIDVGLVTVTPQLGNAHSWEWLSQKAAAGQLRPWLDRLLAESQAVARDWKQVVAGVDTSAGAWRGWYVSAELDNVSWTSASTRSLFVEYERAVCKAVHENAPGKPIAMSGYADRKLPAAEAGAWWGAWLDELTCVDDWLWQDGTGAMARPLDEVRAVSTAIRQATLARQRLFTPIAELFKLHTEEPESAAAVAKNRLLLASELANRASADPLPGWMCFDIPEYVLGTTPEAQVLRPCFLRTNGQGS
jgi:hypothetical protein